MPHSSTYRTLARLTSIRFSSFFIHKIDLKTQIPIWKEEYVIKKRTNFRSTLHTLAAIQVAIEGVSHISIGLIQLSFLVLASLFLTEITNFICHFFLGKGKCSICVGHKLPPQTTQPVSQQQLTEKINRKLFSLERVKVWVPKPVPRNIASETTVMQKMRAPKIP